MAYFAMCSPSFSAALSTVRIAGSLGRSASQALTAFQPVPTGSVFPSASAGFGLI